MKKLVFVILCVFLTSGCATYKMIEAPPQVTEKTDVKFSDEKISVMTELPLGVYRVPDSRVVISGDFKGGVTGMFFGLTGIFIQNAINKSDAKKKFEEVEAQLRWDLNADFQSVSQEIISSDSKFRHLSLESLGTKDQFVIKNYVLLDYVEDVGVTPYIFLKAMKFEGKKRVWRARYIASAGEARRAFEEGGWVGEDNSELRAGVKTAMRKALTVLYRDMVNPFPRTMEKDDRVKLKAQYPYMNKPIKLPGWILDEDDSQLVFIPKAGDALVFSGVNIFDKADVEFVD